MIFTSLLRPFYRSLLKSQTCYQVRFYDGPHGINNNSTENNRKTLGFTETTNVPTRTNISVKTDNLDDLMQRFTNLSDLDIHKSSCIITTIKIGEVTIKTISVTNVTTIVE